MNTNRKQNIALQVIACTVLLLLPIVDAPSPNPKKILFFDNPFIEVDFLLHFFCLAFGYLNYFVFIPRFFQPPLKFFYGVIVLLSLALISAIPWFVSGTLGPRFFLEDADIHFIIQIRHVFFMFLAIFLYSFMTWS